MWKSTSLGVVTRVKCYSAKGSLQVCRVSTQAGGALHQAPSNQPSLKDPLPQIPPGGPKGGESGGGSGFFKFIILPITGFATGVVVYGAYSEDNRNELTDMIQKYKGKITGTGDKPITPGVLIPSNNPTTPATKSPNTMMDKIRKPFLPTEDEVPSKLLKRGTSMPASAPSEKAPVTPKVTPAAPPLPVPPIETETKKAADDTVKQTKAEAARERKEREKFEAVKRQQQKDDEIAAENAALEVILDNLVETCDKSVTEALQHHDKVIDTTHKHTQLYKTAMDDNSKILEKEVQWQSVSMAFEAKDEAVKQAESVIMAAKQNLEKLRVTIDEARANDVTKKNKQLLKAKERLNKLGAEYNKKESQRAKSDSEARVLMKYKDLVDKGKAQFKKELESIMPDVKIGKGRSLTEEELNTLIAHAHRRIEQLQKQLAEQLAMENVKIQESLELQQKEDELLTEERVLQESQKLMDEFALDKDRWEADANVQFELELRRQLARQAAAHSDHLTEVLRVQEEELKEKMEEQVQVELMEERNKFYAEIAGWTARLRGIEQAVESRAESEKTARGAQELWLSCVSLNGAITEGNEAGQTWEDQLRPLEEEVDAVFFSAKNHPFVCLVLESIPETALTRGVYTESNLKDRFWGVKRVCEKVALIDERGGSLFKYMISHMQAKFMINSVSAKNEHDEIGEMDTFQLLNHANFWLHKGDVEQALRFMNQLRGEPRRMASDWIEEARLYLETRQAAQSLMAHASATGLGTVF